MKVMMIMASIGEGGLEKHTVELSQGLVERGMEVCIVAHPDLKKNFSSQIKFIGTDFNKSRRNPFLLAKIYKIIQSENPDIVHSQANKATQIVATLKSFIKTKVVATLHNEKKNLIPFQKSDCVITVSDFIGRNLEHTCKETIYNGINIENIEEIDLYKKFNVPKGKFIVGGIGRFVKAKRFDILIESIRDLDVHLILVGDGPERMKLEGIVQKYQIKDKVTFTGMLDNTDVKKIIKSLHLLCITSEREGFPYVFVETFMLHTPILSTDISDVKKFLPSDYLVSLDRKNIAKKIEHIQNNYSKVQKDFFTLYEKFSQEFSFDTMVERTINVYHKVLQMKTKK